MQSQFLNQQPIAIEPVHLDTQSTFTEPERDESQSCQLAPELTQFYGHFQNGVEMYAEPERVIAYLDTHQEWFRDCAQPMKAEPIGANGYALTIGRFGSFGYEVEPKIGLELLPRQDEIYKIQTIPVPGYNPPGYEVDFQATQGFVPIPTHEYFSEQQLKGLELPPTITRIEWELDLTVGVRFPKFIHKLPQSLIQSTGDRLLQQIVRQVSRRLSHKVQEDFHNRMNIVIPKKLKRR